MSATPPAGKIKFGEWLPDAPDLDNPGITEALNVLRVAGNYVPYLPQTPSGTAFSEVVSAARFATGLGGNALYVGTAGPSNAFLYVSNTGAPPFTNRSAASFSAVGIWSLTQYTETVIATNGIDNPQFQTLGSVSNFAQLTGAFGAAPIAECVGVIGQFIMLGALTLVAPYAVQWSGINAPLNWPTPQSAAAIAQQSGQQFLDPALGIIVGITQGDQWGLILLTGGIVRVTYVGGTVVFQFDTIYRGAGCIGVNAWVQRGNLVYFASAAGFLVCDGVNVVPIGEGKVNQFYLSEVDLGFASRIAAGVAPLQRLIYWSFPKMGNAGVPNEVFAFSFDEGWWTHATDAIAAYVKAEESATPGTSQTVVKAFTQSRYGTLAGAPGVATLTTGEVELNPGGKALVQGFRPQVSGSSPAMTCRIGSRQKQGDAVAFTSAITPTAATGFADCLIESGYHRAEVDITGAFTQALGGEFLHTSTGAF